MKCGTELPDGAKFCYNCGEATIPMASAGPAKNDILENKEYQIQKLHDVIDNHIRQEIAIKGVVGQLYKTFDGLSTKLSRDFTNSLRKRYGASANSLELFIQKGPADVDQLFTAVDENILDFLKGQGIYHVPLSSVRTATRKYSTYWPAFYEDATSAYKGIQTNQQQMRKYREVRKATRGRLIGGGFGLKGAAKGIATAGAVNMTTGMVHSIVNAAGNASSAKDAALRKEIYFKSADFKDTLQWCIQEDCRLMQKAVSDLWAVNVTEKHSIPYYDDTNRDQAYAIAQSLMNNQVPEDRKEDTIFRMISLYPVDIILYHCAENAMPSLKATIRAEAAQYGIFPASLEAKVKAHIGKYALRFANCTSFEKLKDFASYSIEETVSRLYQERANEMSPQFSLIPREHRDENPLAKEIKAMRKSFAEFSDQETPILLAGVGEFSAGSDGLLMTDEAIYMGRYTYALEDIESIEPRIDSNGAKNIVFNGRARKTGAIGSSEKTSIKSYLPVKCNREIFPYLIDTLTFLAFYIPYLQASESELKSGVFLEDLFQWIPEEGQEINQSDGREASNSHEDPSNERPDAQDEAEDFSMRTQKIDEIVSYILDMAFSYIQQDVAFNARTNTDRLFVTCGKMCPRELRSDIQEILASIPDFDSEKELELFVSCFGRYECAVITSKSVYVKQSDDWRNVPLSEIQSLKVKRAMLFKYIYINDKIKFYTGADAEFQEELCKDLMNKIIPYLLNLK